jgi:gliding motility-associated-like protein
MKPHLQLITIFLLLIPLLSIGQISSEQKEQLIGLSVEELIAKGHASEEKPQTTKPLEDTTIGVEKVDCAEAYIPIDGTYTAVPRNDDGSLFLSSMGFTFSFCGTSYTSCYINTNGNISFGQAVAQFSPNGFPYNVPMVAPFWADVDTRNTACGQAWYKLFGNYMIVSWQDVGWYNMNCSPLNTFQLIISDGTAPIIGVGNNVQFRYGDMNWTTGTASGGGPFGGFAATVGYNSGDNINYEQVGRFNVDDSSYDGPFGANDGVHWLDYKCFVFNAGVGTVDLTCNNITRALDANCNLTITPEEVSVVSLSGCADTDVTLDISTFGCDDLGANTVTVTATDGSSSETCTATVTVTAGLCSIASIVPVGPFCDSDGPVFLSASPPGGTWTGAPGGVFNPSQGQGIYTVTYTNPSACPPTADIDIEVFQTPTVTVSPLPAVFCEDVGYIDLSASGTGGDGNYSYNWNTPGGNFSTPTITGFSGGSYFVTITDGNGCEDILEVDVTMNPAPLVSIIDPGLICSSEFFLIMQGIPNGGVWSGIGISDQGELFPSQLGEGSYTFTYVFTDAFGCEGADDFVLEILPSPTAIAFNTGPFCEGGLIELFGDSDIPGSIYQWSGPGGYNSLEQNPDDAIDEGSYLLQVISPEGCPSLEVETIVEFLPGPDADATNFGPYCDGETIQLFASSSTPGTTIYQWFGPGGYTSSEQSPSDATEPGFYTVVINVDGCDSPEAFTEVLINDPPVASAFNSGPYCEGEVIQLFSDTDVQGNNITYEWSGPNGYVSSQQNPTNATEPGDYEVQITVDGCAAELQTTTVEINQINPPVISGEAIYCAGESTSIDAGGGYFTYSWSNGDDTQITIITTPGEYIVTVSNAIGCTAEASLIVNENQLPEPTIQGSATFCSGSASLLDAGAGYAMYSWSTGANTQTINVTISDEYTVTVTDGNGCTGETSLVVTESTALEPVIAGNLVYCEGESTFLDAGAGYDTYLWSNGQVSEVILVNSPGTYGVTVTNNSGCTGETSAAVTENALPVVTILGTASFCEGENSVLSLNNTFTSYLWSTNNTSSTITVTAAGNYGVTVTNTAGCTSEAAIVVTVNDLPQPAISGATSFCEGNSTVINAGSGYATYAWSNGSTSQAITVTQGGSYEVTVTNAEGCTGEAAVTVIENTSLTPQINGELVFCEGDATQLDAGSGYATYLWTGGASTQILPVNATGTYGVTVTDAFGCTGETSVAVTENAPPVVNILGMASFCEGESSVLSLNNTFTSYLWSTNNTSSTITVTAAGSYGVTVTNAAGCTSEAAIVVTVNALPQPAISGATSFCEGNSTVINAGSGYATYAWSNGSTSQSITVTQGGSYEVTVTNAAGCTGEAAVNVIENTSLTPQITGVLAFCEGEASQLNAGNGYASYLWTGGATTQMLSVNATGTYSVTVTDAFGCTGETSVAVTENALPVVSILGAASFCEGESSVLTLNNTFTSYLWSTNNTTSTITVSAGGTYGVTVTDAAGCTDEAAIAVAVNALPQPAISGATSFCEGDNTLVNAGPGYASYAWSNGNTSQTITVTQGGSYNVTVTNNNGCTGEAAVNIIENTSLSPQITGAPTFCEGEASQLDAGNGYATYQWTGGSTSQTLSVDETGAYSVTVTNTVGCTGETTIDVTENTLPQVGILGVTAICDGASTTLSASAGFANYSWSDNSNGSSINVSAAGTFFVVVTDNNGCTGEASINVNLNDNPEPTIAGSTTFCSGSSASLDAGAGYNSYLWSNGATAQIIATTTGGSFTVTVTDASGCTGEASTMITESTSLSPVIAGALDFCEGENTTLNAGVGFSSYSWSNGSSNQSLQVAAPGNYSVTVSDASGCTGETTAAVVENNSPTFAISGNVPVCEGESLVLNAGAGFEEYLWSNQSLNPTLTVNTSGTYSVIVTDINGCTAEQSVQAVINANPEPSILGATTFCTGNEITISLDDTYATYQWSNGMNTQSIQVNTGGNYSVVVSLSSGCTAEAQISISENDNLQPTIDGDLSFCGGGSTMLTASPGFTYEWSNNMNTQSITVSNTGQYSVIITDATGCTGTTTVDVEEYANPEPGISGSTTFCTGSFATLDAGSGYSSYLWSNGASTQTVEVNTQNNYSVMVTDANGCTGETQIQVIESTSLSPAISGNLLLCDGEITTLNVGAGFDTYNWSTGATTPSITTDVAGDYSVTVSDGSGCTGEGTVALTVNSNPSVTISGAAMFCGDENTLLDAGTGYADYLWTNGTTDQNILATTSGSYGITVTDNNGCTAEYSLTVTQNQEPVISIIGPASFCSGNSVNLSVTGSYVAYQWSTGASSAAINLSTSSAVSVTVTDANGCTGEANTTVTENTQLTPVVSGPLSFCEGESTMLDAGAGWQTYQWSTGANTQTVTITAAGNYEVIITDSDGCSGSETITVSTTANPEPIIAGSTTFCIGSSTTLDAGNYASWQWSNGDTNQSIVTNQPGDYSVIVTDANGCTEVASTTISESTSLSPVISGVPAFCQGESTLLDAGLGFATYAWSDGSSNQQLLVNATGDYSITVTDASGCSGEAVITVNEVSLPIATLQNGAEICNTELSGSFLNLYDLVIAGDMSGSWMDADNSGASGLFNNINFDGIPAGEYNFIYTTNSAVTPCAEVSYPVVITVLECACGSVSLLPANPLCNSNGQLNLANTVITNEPGVWSIQSTPLGANPALLNGSNFYASGADAGIYTLQYQLSNTQPANCPDVFVQSIVVDQEVNAGVANLPLDFCENESNLVALPDLILGEDANGQWTETSVNSSQGTAFNAANGTFNANGQNPGTYTFQYEVSGAITCPDQQAEVSVTINEQPIAVAGNSVELTCNDPTSSLNAVGSSSGANYAISWSGPGIVMDGSENSLTPTIAAGGTYELVVTNMQTGCSATDEVQVTEAADIPVALAGADQEITCDQLITVLQPGQNYGTDYLITWGGPGITTANMNDLNPEVSEPGTYTLVVTLLANGCSSSPDLVEVIPNNQEPEILAITPLSSIDCNFPEAELIVSSPGVNVSYEWTDANGNVLGNNATLADITEEGIYTVLVTNTQTGCTATEDLEVVNNVSYPFVNINQPNVLDCNQENTMLDGTGSQTGAGILYNWSGPDVTGAAGSLISEASTPGTYVLLVTNTSNGCTSTLSVEVNQNIAAPQAVIATPEQLDCQVETVSLSGSGSTSGSNISYQWYDAANTELGSNLVISVGDAGDYLLIVTDANNGCTDEATISVLQNENLPQAALIDLHMPVCAGESTGLVWITGIEGGTAPYSYSFNGSPFSNDNFYPELSAGVYDLALVDANGCDWSTTIIITEPDPIDFDLGSDIELSFTDSAVIDFTTNLSPNQIDTIIWRTSGAAYHCEDEGCFSISISTYNSLAVSAELIDVNGCSVIDQLMLRVNLDRKVYIPNAFSPNGDEANDVFMIYADAEQVEKVNFFRVFNRWGEIVFEHNHFDPNNKEFSWDGRFRGDVMNPAVFVYVAEILFVDGHVEMYKGDVTLMR